jgi:hypothetical protein
MRHSTTSRALVVVGEADTWPPGGVGSAQEARQKLSDFVSCQSLPL